MTATAPAHRDDAASLVVDALRASAPGSEVQLIGSAARPHDADAFSDIDLRWTMPAGLAAEPVCSLRATMQRIGVLDSLRVDPEVRPEGLLVFVRFRDWPLWWRVDLEVHSTGLDATRIPDRDPWSSHESACMGVVVTLKALARHRPEAADELLHRALRQVGATDVTGNWSHRLDSLLDRIDDESPSTSDLVARTRLLCAEVLGQGMGSSQPPPSENVSTTS